MAGFKFKKSNFNIEVEGKKYESTLSMADIADKFKVVADKAHNYKVESDDFKSEMQELINLVKNFVNEVFGENAFDAMTETLDVVEMDSALQLFEYITQEFNSQKIDNITKKYSPDRAKRK